MANILNLDPEWGAIDLIEEIEGTFGIEVADEDAERCNTIGDLYDIIRTQTSDWDDKTGSCASSAVFYMMRRASGEKALFTPSTQLDGFGGQTPRRLFKNFRAATGLRLPILNLTGVGGIGWLICLIGVVALIATVAETAWWNAGLACGVMCIGIAMVAFDPLRLPTGIVTVGDLVRRTVPLNVQRLRSEGRRAPDMWATLVGLAADHGSIPSGDIEPSTFLIASRKNQRSARA